MSQFYSYPPISVVATNPSVGINGSPIPGSSTLVAGENPSGLEQPLQTDASGNLLVSIDPSAQPIDVNLTEVGGAAVVLGQALMAASIPVVLASNQSSVDVTVTSSALPAGAATEVTLSSIDGKLPTVLGQTTSAGSLAVVIASDQSPVAVSAASLPLPAGAATEATLSAFSDKTAGSLVPELHDYLDITYVGATTDIDTVVYKTGGSGGTTVATLTMGYDGSNRLTSVTRS